MASWVGIANRGLRWLGVAPIQSLEETSTAARAVNGVYQQLRDELLASHPWGCALRRLTLAASTEPPAYGFALQYPLPADPYVLRVWRLGVSAREGIDYRVEGRMLLTNAEGPLQAQCLVRIEDPELLSAWVAAVLSANIAAELAFQLTSDKDMVQLAEKRAEDKRRLARAMDAQEGTREKPWADDFLRSRY